MTVENAYMDGVSLNLGVFDQRCFYRAFEEFDNQSIDKSLVSDNLIVRIFAILEGQMSAAQRAALSEFGPNIPLKISFTKNT